MGAFDNLTNNLPETDEDIILTPRGESLEAPEAAPETVEDALLVNRQERENIEQEEDGYRFGNPVELAEQFNNTIISAAGAPVDMLNWAINSASKALGGPQLIDPDTAIGGSKNLKVLNRVGIGSDREADTFMGYAGQTLGEGAAFLTAGAGVVQKTKQAKGVIGAISREADTALKTDLGKVVALEAVAAVGMAAGREIADNEEMGTTAALLTEFTTGAFAMLSAAGAKKVILDPLTSKLKNMTAKEALEKLSKEEVAEVVAEGQRVLDEGQPAPKATKEELEVELKNIQDEIDAVFADPELSYFIDEGKKQDIALKPLYAKLREVKNNLREYEPDVELPVLYRGVNNDVNPLEMRVGQDGKPYGLFFSTRKETANSYIRDSSKDADAFELRGVKESDIIDVPVKDGSFNKVEFDRLVKDNPTKLIRAKGAVDVGPQASTERDPDMLFSNKSDIYGTQNPEFFKKKGKPAPKTDAEIDAMSDDELLAELGVEASKPQKDVPEGSFRSELDGNVYTKKAELEEGVSVESGRIAGDGDLSNLPEGLRDILEPIKDSIQRLNLTIGKNGIGLDTIVVMKASRGKGVGTQIIKDIIKYADSKNLPVVLTPSNQNGAKLNDYYKSLGFTDNVDGIGKQKLIRKPKETPEAPEFTIAIDKNPRYDGPNGNYKKFLGYKVRAKDGKDYYIETASSEQPSDSRFVVHEGSDMHGEWIGSFPTKKEAVEFLQSKKAKAPETPKDAPEPTPAPLQDAETGKPITIKGYHGTKTKFDEFDPNVTAEDKPFSFGSHFTTSKAEAEVYATSVKRAADTKKGESVKLEGDERIIEADLTLENPLVIKTDMTSASMYADANKDDILKTLEEAKAAGNEHDGVIIQRRKGDGYDQDNIIVFDNKKIKTTPKPPEAAPKADPIDEAIENIDSILKGDRTGGKGARVTRDAKRLFRNVAKDFFGDIKELIKTKDVAQAKKILAKIDKYIEFDRKISEKDYAQGSELQANSRNAMENGTTDYSAGISAAGNKRTEDLTVLKGMLERFVKDNEGPTPRAAEDVPVGPKGPDADDIAKQADESKPRTSADPDKPDAPKTPKVTTEEAIDAIADQTAKTFMKDREGPLQSMLDGYFTVRLTQMLNQAKTAFVGVPSATIMSVVRPLINTPYNISKAMKLKGATLSRRVQYATADLTATYEYLRMFTKHLGDTTRSVGNTILNKGDSNFLYRDRNAYIKNELAEATEAPHRVKKAMMQAQRRQDARNATGTVNKAILRARATVMNSKPMQVPSFFFDYGVSLIGGLEEISLIAHSMRAARAAGIKKGIDEGVDDVWKYSEDYMEGALDRSRGSVQAKYDPEYADVFNQARKDHFRAMDLDPSDIRRDLIDGMVAGLSKLSDNPDEAGLLARTLFVFIGVPFRALGANLSYIASPYNVVKRAAGKSVAAAEGAFGEGNVSRLAGKFNKRIGELNVEIKEQKALMKSDDKDVAKQAEKLVAEKESELARIKDIQTQESYEELGKLAIGGGMFFLGYEMAKNGQVAGTDSWMTEEQKMAVQKVNGAPNSWKVVLGGKEMDFKYMEPLKGVFALGADYARRQAAADADALTEDQTITQFLTSVTKSIATDSPFATGARYMTQIMAPNPETQERGVMGVVRSLVPVPAEVRNINKFDEEFVTDTTAGDFADTVVSASIGRETGNYRLTLLGEPKEKEEPSLLSFLMAFAPKTVPEREPIDDILLEDAMSFKSVSAVPTSIQGFRLGNFIDPDTNETLYSRYGQLISEKRLEGKTLRQSLNALVKTRDFKDAYKAGYEMNEEGREVNEGIEMIKGIISDYRSNARDIILNSKAASDYTDSDGNNIYDILKEREQFSEQPESLLENLNLQ